MNEFYNIKCKMFILYIFSTIVIFFAMSHFNLRDINASTQAPIDMSVNNAEMKSEQQNDDKQAISHEKGSEKIATSAPNILPCILFEKSDNILSHKATPYELGIYSLERLEKIVLLLNAFIILFGLVSFGSIFYVLRKIIEGNKEFEDRILVQTSGMKDSINQQISDQVTKEINHSMSSRLEQAMQICQKDVQLFLDQDFAAELERRYLAADYLSTGMQNQVINILAKAIEDKDAKRVKAAWDQLRRGQMAIRQTLSSNSKDVFAGLGTLREMTRMKQISKISLWNLICVLKGQNRLDQQKYEPCPQDWFRYRYELKGLQKHELNVALNH